MRPLLPKKSTFVAFRNFCRQQITEVWKNQVFWHCPKMLVPDVQHSIWKINFYFFMKNCFRVQRSFWVVSRVRILISRKCVRLSDPDRWEGRIWHILAFLAKNEPNMPNWAYFRKNHIDDNKRYDHMMTFASVAGTLNFLLAALEFWYLIGSVIFFHPGPYRKK